MTSDGPTYSHRRRNSAERIALSLAGASTVPYWLDSPDRPSPEPRLVGQVTADLLVVGGGYSGLWTALIAKEADPSRDVVLIEGKEVGWAASGRNGGFFEESLTHGVDNGERHFADELPELDRLADENFDEFVATLDRLGIDAEFEHTGVLTVATEPHQVDALREVSGDGVFLDREAVQALVHSPVYLAGQREWKSTALVHPAKLAWGLKRACIELGVRVFEHTPATRLRRSGDGVAVTTKQGGVQARQVALATNGFPSLLKRTELLTIPVYDYVLMTEPLSPEQLESIGWTDRFGIADSSREFHYSRRSADDRILYGGFDAVYHRGGRIRPEHDQRRETFETLADHFFTTYPQLDVRFTHAWGGMIDMCSRLSAFQGTALGGRVAYSAGFTGLGVGATRFGAKVMLDLLSGESTELTRLKMVRSKPIPIPPEPIANPAIQTVRRAVACSDANEGRDGLLLKVMDRFGIGFDS
ncbi:NAD(P)/FAD-dependent oxidoreductase [Plantibacter cousiniae (nom. nud.)]|uniref:NAD(P)/FAD-dependent oxidoreductase n=1 Tax=Plantibacter cousiniae (nom. nud.) TaxID=199709 RepID=UPI001DBFB2AB|nr:FAD-dependent oxidoreductase [Plantibacter cousiniae]CAH0210754.1 Gamma-glutamylputrescine oxidoreductase [Plantibacter cousiniae]